MQHQLGALAACTAAFVYILLRGRRRLSTIRDIPGPENPSWIFGHQWYLQSEEVGGPERRFLENFGNVVRWNGPCGEDRLWIVDPKALNHIIQKSGYSYSKQSKAQEGIVFGHGIMWADVELPSRFPFASAPSHNPTGDIHKRHRRTMAPAFGLTAAKSLLPYFMDAVIKMVDKWNDIIENGKSGNSADIDVNLWVGKATLDAIGAGAFDYDFGALDDSDNPLTKSYTDLIFASFGNPSRLLLFFTSVVEYFPGLIVWLYNNSNDPGMRKLRHNTGEVRRVAQQLLDSKRQELKDGTPRKDIMSLLVKASDSQRQDWRLTDDEIISQVQTIMLAGHETIAKSLTFAFWELAKHRDCQEKLRAEINETLAKVNARGDADFTANDFESMPYLVAVTKEVLRIHSVAIDMERVPIEDDVIPLTKPIVGTSGKVYTELHVPSGTPITISLVGHSLNPDLWGPDAFEFRPERWLEMDEQVESPVGVYGNLAAFSGGVRSCIGWRFAVIEIQVFLVTLIRKFDISPADHYPQIKRAKSGVMVPLVLGEEYKGTQLPLKITAIRNS